MALSNEPQSNESNEIEDKYKPVSIDKNLLPGELRLQEAGWQCVKIVFMDGEGLGYKKICEAQKEINDSGVYSAKFFEYWRGSDVNGNTMGHGFRLWLSPKKTS